MPFKVYIVGGGEQYEQMFKSRGWEVAESLNEADVVQFTGGHDISPAIYNRAAHRTTSTNILRDIEEMSAYIQAFNKPKLGICRGAQLLFALNGGILHQDVNNHGRSHSVKVTEGKYKKKDIEVTSTHHQQMSYESMRDNQDFRVLAYTTELSTIKEDKKIPGVDLEACFFVGTKTLCFQPHPEFAPGLTQDLYFSFVEEFIEPYVYQG